MRSASECKNDTIRRLPYGVILMFCYKKLFKINAKMRYIGLQKVLVLFVKILVIL